MTMKRILSLVLVLLIIAALPVSAMAAEEDSIREAFDTTGDYGWICKCGWTRDRAQAILLSGKEPRILTPDQLRNLHKQL